MGFEAFLENLIRIGLEYFGRFYGIYRGIVVSNSDPEARGRIKVIVPAVGHKEGAPPNVWVEPAFDGAGSNRGGFWPPEIDDGVWISFQNGDPRRPEVYWGGWYGAPDSKTEVPTEFQNGDGKPVDRRGWVTRAGHVVVFDNENGKEAIRIIWHKPISSDKSLTDRSVTADRTKGDSAKLAFESDGSITLEDKSKNTAILNASGIELRDKDQNKIVISGGKIEITSSNEVNVITKGFNAKTQTVTLTDGADAAAVRGPDLLRWLSSHIHPTSSGPSGPPSSPPPQSILAKKTKVGR